MSIDPYKKQKVAPITLSYEGTRIRAVIRDGMVWWKASDIGNVLGEGHDMLIVPEGLRDLVYFPSPKGYNASLSEAGLYFYLAYSLEPMAIPLQKWITWKAMPEIRKMKEYKK
jgi:prophage antirepressor-like protein